MRIAIFSDVHGNLTALQAVLNHLDGQAPVDQAVCAGDICLFGPRPVECLAAIRHGGIAFVAGNTDEWLINPPPLQVDQDEKTRKNRQHIQDWSFWAQEMFSGDDFSFLNDVRSSFELRFSPTGNQAEDLLVVHANPKDLLQVIYPPLEIQRSLLGEIRQPDEELELLLGEVKAAALAFGHLHIPSIRIWQHLLLANISSVSLPGDGDNRAKYAILSWDRVSGWMVQHYYVKYDIAFEISAFKSSKPPGWKLRVESLSTRGIFPQ